MKYNSAKPKYGGCRSNFIYEIKCDECGKALSEQPLISTQCLHRFCPSCASSSPKTCPKCGASTGYRLDSNFSQLISKVNDQSKNKTTMKRRIVDVLQNDGDLLSQPQSGRCSRMTLPNSPAKQIRADQSPMKLAPSPHANGPSTSSYGSAAIAHSGGSKSPIACKSSEPMDATRSSDGEFDGGWNKIAGSLLTRRLQLNRSIYNMEAIVLWPDGVNYRLRELPHCMLRPRYLYVPSQATVAHLAEYLFKRAKLEADTELRFNHRVEIMPIEDEREEINLWVNPLRDIDYLSIDFKNNMQNANTGEYVLILRKNQEDSYFCTNLIMRHPFESLPEKKTVAEMLEERRRNNTAVATGASTDCCRPANMAGNVNGKTNCANGLMTSFESPSPPIGQSSHRQQEKEKRPPKFIFRFVPHTPI